MSHTLYFNIAKKFLPILFIMILLVCPNVYALEYEVSAAVAPMRIILVNSHQVIIEISSNCQSNVEPKVYLQGSPNRQVAYSSVISKQYIELSKTINFSKPGIVYKKIYITKLHPKISVADSLWQYIAVL